MIFLDRPYVSDFFLNYLCESGRAVLRTPFTEELSGTCPSERPLNLVDDPDAEKLCRSGAKYCHGGFFPRDRRGGKIQLCKRK